MPTGTWELCGMNLDLAGRSMNSLFKGQIPGAVNPFTASAVMKWDGVAQRYRELWIHVS